MIKAHKFVRDRSMPTKTMMFHGKTKFCLECKKPSWHPVHDPENWAKRYVNP